MDEKFDKNVSNAGSSHLSPEQHKQPCIAQAATSNEEEINTSGDHNEAGESGLPVQPGISPKEPLVQDDNLCQLCTAIDFDTIFQSYKDSGYAEYKKVLVCTLDHELSRVTSDTKCPLCRLFAQARSSHGLYKEKEQPGSKYSLSIVKAPIVAEKGNGSPSFGEIFFRLDREPVEKSQSGENDLDDGINSYPFPVTVYGQRINQFSSIGHSSDTWDDKGRPMIICGKRLEVADKHTAQRLVDPDEVNYALVRSWLSPCEANHKADCVKSKAISLPGFSVVDCSTHEVIPAPKGCKYVALSYVCGTPTADTGSRGGGLKNAPPVITDAIVATKKLGYRYLWVDRHCIDQENVEQKHQQISNMDLIYGTADLTLIVAAGEDTSFGIPGVRAKSRSRMPSVTIGGWLLDTLPPNPKYEIEKSKWFTRGWTYQEALLSPRRLVFTETQVYFQCQKMGCLESVSYPVIQKGETAESQKFTLVFPTRGIGSSAEFPSRLSEYLKRKLSYQSDILNAFLGILKAYQQRESFFHICGVPIWVSNSRETHGGVRLVSNTDATMAFNASLRWTTFSLYTITRREGFPSWSWTGWNSPSADLSWNFNRGRGKREGITSKLWHNGRISDVGALGHYPGFEHDVSELGVTHFTASFEFQLKDGGCVAWPNGRLFDASLLPRSNDVDALKLSIDAPTRQILV
ncbi:hypothetical protein GALMADRAFT_256831 [Galerina marginata CBS 339.88]|uniref:Heterokaryon incompatibility domain-containing protein n=1 Tax=Galerina marginata (strain CBS 339.88) TaxID=685588 RepID=A0A067SLJ7_GALM3|nr:hypothetical protein GALMADRAFT_256831 [Galerina marginata CBS 339.88]